MQITGFDPEQGYQQFMNLIVAQIQYQDPLEPVSQENVTAQLAQISTVSGINELNLQFRELFQMQTLFDGANMVGSNVEYVDPETGASSFGTVTEVRSENEQLIFTVNDRQIAMADIVAVSSNSASSPQ